MGMNPIKATAVMAKGRGGQKGITAADIAHAYAGGLSREAYLLALAKWADDPSGLQEARHIIWSDRILMLAAVKHWKDQEASAELRRLVDLAVVETVHPKRCPECGGVGTMPIVTAGKGVEDVPCAECGSTGKVAMSGRSRAKMAHISQSCWSRRWGVRYERDIFPIVSGLLGEAYEHLKHRLR